MLEWSSNQFSKEKRFQVLFKRPRNRVVWFYDHIFHSHEFSCPREASLMWKIFSAYAHMLRGVGDLTCFNNCSSFGKTHKSSPTLPSELINPRSFSTCSVNLSEEPGRKRQYTPTFQCVWEFNASVQRRTCFEKNYSLSSSLNKLPVTSCGSMATK